MALLTQTTTRRRTGFTLVELMVSAAVSVIIMAILATVFQSGIDVMRDMRSLGSLQDQLRAATEMIRRDLQANHFLPRDTRGSQGQLISGSRLSDQWPTEASWVPPLGGFFHIESNSSWTTSSGADKDGLSFARTQTPSFKLHFTSILPGDKPQNLYSATVNGTTLSSPAAEIAYFVDSSVPTNFRLIRRQRLVAKAEADKTTLASAGADVDVLAVTAGKFDDLATVADTSHRITPLQPLSANNRTGDDVLLSNVLMFEVKANWEGGTPVSQFATNSDNPFDFMSVAGNQTFDTGFGTTTTNTLLKVRVKGLQIRMRLYDPQLKSTRQVTIVQDL